MQLNPRAREGLARARKRTELRAQRRQHEHAAKDLRHGTVRNATESGSMAKELPSRRSIIRDGRKVACVTLLLPRSRLPNSSACYESETEWVAHVLSPRWKIYGSIRPEKTRRDDASLFRVGGTFLGDMARLLAKAVLMKMCDATAHRDHTWGLRRHWAGDCRSCAEV